MEGDKVELLFGKTSGNQYADAFLALENEYSGMMEDVYTKTMK
jgi:hypothetical protein